MTFISQFSDVDLNYFSASNTVWFYWQDATQASYAVLRQLLLRKRSVCMICTSVCCYVEHAGRRLPTRVTRWYTSPDTCNTLCSYPHSRPVCPNLRDNFKANLLNEHEVGCLGSKREQTKRNEYTEPKLYRVSQLLRAMEVR